MNGRWRATVIALSLFGCLLSPLPVAADTSSRDWDMYGNGQDNAFAADTSFSFTSIELWNLTLEGILGRTMVEHDGLLFIHQAGERIVALSSGTGKEAWNRSIGVNYWASMAVWDDYLLVPALDGTLHALNRTTGEDGWALEIADSMKSPITVHDDTAYLTTYEPGHLFAINLTSHEAIWNVSLYQPFFTPAIEDDILYIANWSQPATAFAIHASNGTEVWNSTLGTMASSDASVKDGVVLFTTSPGGVEAINASDKGDLWETSYTYPASPETPTISGDKVFIAADDSLYGYHGTIHAVNLTDGGPLWSQGYAPHSVTQPIAFDQYILTLRSDATLLALFQTNGTTAWTETVEGHTGYRTPLLSDQRLFFATTATATEKDVLHCYGMGPRVEVLDMAVNRTVANVTEHVGVTATLDNVGNMDAFGEVLDFFIDVSTVPVLSKVVDVPLAGSTSSYFDWDTTGYEPGDHTVTARVRSTGSQMTSETITLLSVKVPELYILGFYYGPLVPVAGEPVDILVDVCNNGTADASGVQVRVKAGSNVIGQKDIDVPVYDIVEADFVWDTDGLPPGDYNLTATVSHGNIVLEANLTVRLHGPEDIVDILDVICEPDEVHPDSFITINATVRNKGHGYISDLLVSFKLDGELIGMAQVDYLVPLQEVTVGMKYLVHANASIGPHTIVVEAEGSSNSTILVVVEDVPEKVFYLTLLASEDTVFLGDTVTIEVTVNYTGAVPIETVILFLRDEDTANLSSQDIGPLAPHQTKVVYFYITMDQPGTQTLTAYIPETGESNQVSIIVKETPSTSFSVEITAPSNGSTVSGAIVVTVKVKVPHGLELSRVEVLVDGGPGTTMSPGLTSGTYNATLDTTILSEGGHTLRVRAVTTGDLSSSDEISVIVDNEPGVGPPPTPPPPPSTTTQDGSWMAALALILVLIVVIILLAMYIHMRGRSR